MLHHRLSPAGIDSAVWKKSSRSNGNGGNNCVEVAQLDTSVIALRDSKNPSGPALIFNSASWTEFVNSTKDGEFDINS
ncbi:MAG: hypothetical protein QOE51_3366 [Actinoplanes sp.]|jgi:hypothetical protein|nr:hypothetical protein [Actinoplanes sp.]